MVATHFKQILKSLDNWWLLGETAEHWVTTTWVKGTWSDSHSTKRKENRFIYRTTATVTHAGIETGSRPNHYTLDHLTLCGKQSYKNLCLFIQALRNSESWFFGAKIIYCFHYSGTRWRKREVGEKIQLSSLFIPCSLFQCWMRFIWVIGAQLECRSNSRNGKSNKTPENSSWYELKPCLQE